MFSSVSRGIYRLPITNVFLMENGEGLVEQACKSFRLQAFKSNDNLKYQANNI